MTIVFAVLFVVSFGFAMFFLIRNKKLEEEMLGIKSSTQATISDAQKAADQRVAAMQQESQASVAEAQKLIDQQFAEMQQEGERIKQHYESESRKVQEAADALVAKTIKAFEPLRKYEKFRDAESEAQRQLADALKEATSLRTDAKALLEQARSAAANERSAAIQRTKEIREQADALLNQATRDAGRIMAEAEKRAEEIGGEAYVALRDKQLLEQAAAAMRNVIEGYGDRYIIPTHSLLDDLAVEFGYDSAGQALKSARDQSRRMVEQNEAAACDYVETNRREIAIRFVVDAFNGRVDASGTDTVNKVNWLIPTNKLHYGSNYQWQVRYQDSRKGWSSYSTKSGFTTGGPLIGGAKLGTNKRGGRRSSESGRRVHRRRKEAAFGTTPDVLLKTP